MSTPSSPPQPRVALVTGAGRGIGRAIALALAEDGCDIAVNYRRDAEAAARTVEDITRLGRKAVAYAAAVDDADAVTDMVARCGSELGAPTVFVSNAGIASRGATVEHTESAELERVMRIHALASHRICQLLIPAMRAVGHGNIVMISSIATKHLPAGGAPYNMAKAALEALAYTLAKELRPDRIRVNIVAPGLVETEMGRRLVKATQGIDDIRELDAVMPFGRVCRPDDIADAVRFLVSERGSYITGERLGVSGGD